MIEDKDESSGFKVVDRRTFTDEGARREEPRREETFQDTSPASSKFGADSVNDFPIDSSALEETGFSMLVSYLSTTAMFQLGMMAGPSGEPIPVDLLNARRTIDLLEVLQEKTEGNLTSDEAKMLEEVLYELRMTFVEVQRQMTQKKK